MITTMMKKEYIIPTIFFLKYEEESELLVSLSKAASVHAAPDVQQDAMGTDNTKLNIDNTGSALENGFAKKTDWFFDDNAFSDSWQDSDLNENRKPVLHLSTFVARKQHAADGLTGKTVFSLNCTVEKTSMDKYFLCFYLLMFCFYLLIFWKTVPTDNVFDILSANLK